ncbi:nucleolar protein CgrA [Purpureocillium lavendulum]|uniref:Nucleolar protein CgrA n=1 Tax=Purpureocillium lavendulum TaxID=1247861 RepID=A0AB34G4R5_9HYPO|nr:nucleolar protein CgrA [Purpureocillium lavendulum]
MATKFREPFSAFCHFRLGAAHPDPKSERPILKMTDDEQAPALVSVDKPSKPLGMRKNGKQWHPAKKAFRPTAGLTTYAKRQKQRAEMAQMKAKEKELKDEKEELRQQRIQAIREKRAKKEEKERYEKMAEKMHRKRVERLKRKEKRNKVLNS